MKDRSILIVIVLCALVFIGSTGCAHLHGHGESWSSINQAVAVMHPTLDSNTRGTVTFTQVSGGVHISADIEGLNPGAMHAIHIHQYGDARDPKGKSAGGHYNPQNHPHAGPAAAMRHAGDLGNLEADSTGRAHYERLDTRISIAGLKNPVIGRGIIIHAGADDLTTQPTGAAGARIAIGIIGVAKPAN